MTAPTGIEVCDPPKTALVSPPEPGSERRLTKVRPSERSDLADLLKAAKEGLPAETIKTLVELCHVESDRRAKQEFNAAFAAFQKACPMVPRTKVVDYTSKSDAGMRVHYAYAPLEQIITTIRPHLDANDLSYSWDCDELTKPGNLIVTCTIGHISGAERKSVAQGPIDSPTKMSPLQKVNAARTTLQRTSLIGALGLVNCDDDPDGNESGGASAALTEAQRHTILDLLMQMNANPATYVTFAKSYGVEKIGDIPGVCFGPACDRLNKQIAEAAKK